MADQDRIMKLLGEIAARGGQGHWTWVLIDDVCGEGFSESASQDAEEAREAQTEAELRRPLVGLGSWPPSKVNS